MKSLVVPASLVLAGAFALAGCASMNSSSTVPLLSAAGFRVKSPETAKQRELYDQLPAYELQRGTHDGKIFYAYKDEQQGIAYIGGETEYQKYQQLAVQRSIASDELAAAQMNQAMAYSWYGAWGPYYRPYYW